MNNKEEVVVLIDPEDRVIGEMEKLEAHKLGVLHRAISVFIFNNEGQMLLQQRAKAKYHSPNLWTNACCSHPRPNESYEDAADRRIYEELGIQTSLKKIFSFVYKADVGNGFIEHENDHVFIGTFTGEVPFNDEEVKAIEWKTVNQVKTDIEENPDRYTAWFKIIFDKFLHYFTDESQLI